MAQRSDRLSSLKSSSIAFWKKNVTFQQLACLGRRFAWSLVPQIVRSSLSLEELGLPDIKPTTWIDGLRGWCALVVFNFHFFFAFTDASKVGFGYNENYRGILQLPIIRLIHDGGTPLNMFFIVAGYVCSTKAQYLMTTNQHAKLAEGMASSVFRRFFRLYLPVASMTLIATLLAFCGFYDYLRPMFDNRKEYFATHLSPARFSEPQLARHSTLGGQLGMWFGELSKLANISRPGAFYPDHDNHLWSIQCEFRASMYLYMILLGLAKFRPRVRIGCLWIMTCVYLGFDQWEMPCFLVGAVIAQHDVLRSQSRSLLDPPPERMQDEKSNPRAFWKNSWITMLRLLGYTVALHLLSYPLSNYKQPAPGYIFLNQTIPSFYKTKERFHKSIGGLLLLYLLTTAPTDENGGRPGMWHWALTCKPARYLAKNMFSLYLVHAQVLHIFGYGIPHKIWGPLPVESITLRYTGLGVGWAVSLVVCILLADVFTREIEARCSKATDWLQRSLSVNA